MKRKSKNKTIPFDIETATVGDSHFGYIAVTMAEHIADMKSYLITDNINYQLLAYAMGGDLMQHEKRVTFDLAKADYHVVEERVLNHMAKDEIDKSKEVAVKQQVKPTRTPKKRDWEQRTKKGRKR